MKNILLACFVFFFGIVSAQKTDFTTEEVKITPLVEGTLLAPDKTDQVPLVILIAGSGPTDRNGNQMMMKNNSLKFLAEGLLANGIASFRYDKRIMRIMKMGQIDERKINFDHFIEDAVAVLNHFKNDERFSSVTIIGHSQGSLVGMVAAQQGADKFVSIAGAGQEIDDVIIDQLRAQAPGLTENAQNSFNDMRTKGVAENYSPGLSSIFRPAIQPFLITWMQYDPRGEIAKLDIPVLIVNGDKDLQVQVSEAQLLYGAKPNAALEIIENMNHIFKEIEGDDLDNQKSYNEGNRPVMPELIEIITNFVLEK